MMIHIVLFEPEIPANTGNIIRLCANTGAQLHLIKPLGFLLEDKQLRRAGLDYHEYAKLKIWDNLTDCLFSLGTNLINADIGVNIFALTTKTTQSAYAPHTGYTDANVVLVFGPETRGLPSDFLQMLPKDQCVRLPMQADSRSLNLSNSVAVMLYEVWRQNGFKALSTST